MADDRISPQTSNWLPFLYVYTRRLLLLTYDILQEDRVPESIKDLFNVKTQTTLSRNGIQFMIPGPLYKIGKETVQYRGPVIWNLLNRIVKFNQSINKDSFKQMLRRFSKDINFSFKAPTIAHKDLMYIYFWLQVYTISCNQVRSFNFLISLRTCIYTLASSISINFLFVLFQIITLLSIDFIK